MRSAPTQVYRNDEVLPALRELLCRYPATIYTEPEKLASLLYVLCYMPDPPEVREVEAALEALALEGEVAA